MTAEQLLLWPGENLLLEEALKCVPSFKLFPSKRPEGEANIYIHLILAVKEDESDLAYKVPSNPNHFVSMILWFLIPMILCFYDSLILYFYDSDAMGL